MLASVIPFRELIFCEGALSFKNIIDSIAQLPAGTAIKFHANGSNSIVGSNSKDRSGEFVARENGFRLSHPHNRRLKRLIDVFVSIAGILTFPVQVFIIKKPLAFLGNCLSVLFAQKTWIGYVTKENTLPRLRRAIISCNGIPYSATQQLPAESLQKIDYWYARDYSVTIDLSLLKKTYRHLGG
jgi:lipopolysaccharide/colanic/teichoic acid biosynthesis glycosyltransferase